jgi:hypothetical protein
VAAMIRFSDLKSGDVILWSTFGNDHVGVVSGQSDRANTIAVVEYEPSTGEECPSRALRHIAPDTFGLDHMFRLNISIEVVCRHIRYAEIIRQKSIKNAEDQYKTQILKLLKEPNP